MCRRRSVVCGRFIPAISMWNVENEQRPVAPACWSGAIPGDGGPDQPRRHERLLDSHVTRLVALDVSQQSEIEHPVQMRALLRRRPPTPSSRWSATRLSSDAAISARAMPLSCAAGGRVLDQEDADVGPGTCPAGPSVPPSRPDADRSPDDVGAEPGRACSTTERRTAPRSTRCSRTGGGLWSASR